MEQRTLEEKRQNVQRLLDEASEEKINSLCRLYEAGFFELPAEEMKALFNRVQNMTPEELEELQRIKEGADLNDNSEN
jgi:hypothetical protein